MQFNEENAKLNQPSSRLDRQTDLPVSAVFLDLSHELRTSMNGAIGMLELLLDTELTASQQQFASAAYSSVENLLGLIENVVDLSIIEANQFKLNQTSFDLRQEIQSVGDELAVLAHQTGTELVVQSPSFALIKGDPARVRQMTTALVHSALHFTTNGTITLSTALSECQNQCHLRNLRIQVDTHIAHLAADQRQALLNEPGAALRLLGKTGLEFTLCKQLANLMGGDAGIECGGDQNYSFWLAFDVARAPPPLIGVKTLLLHTQGTERCSIEASLKQEGMCIEIFDAPSAALEALAQAVKSQAPYRIALLEVGQMQSEDATSWKSSLQTTPAYRELHLIALRGQTETSVQQPLPEVGFSAVVNTTASPQELVKVLTDLYWRDRHDLSANALDSPRSDQAVSSHSVPALAPTTPFIGRRILLAEDNPVNQHVAQRMLEKLGCVVDVASNGLEALLLFERSRYDLVLMDCQMPTLNGYDATLRLRSMEKKGHPTPILALTASATPADKERCRHAGMDDFISKPIRPRMLQETLQRWLPAANAMQPETDPEYSDELEAVHAMFAEDFAELAALYQSDSPKRIAELRRAARNAEAEQISKIAHAFSGSCASIGASSLSLLCKELEMRAKAGLLKDFEMRLNVIESEYSRISNKLRSMLATTWTRD